MTNLLSLPDAALSKSSEYLSAYTRLLFASAFESISTVVLPDRNSFAKLNLGRLGLNLARRLSDDDIRSMLSVIGAENITEFELGGCINITGEGLEPLRQSTSIVRIDLGGLMFPFSTPPSVSKETVIPILRSIMATETSDLKCIKFNKRKWGKFRQVFEEFAEYLTRRFGLDPGEHFCYECLTVTSHALGGTWCRSCDRFHCEGCSMECCNNCKKCADSAEIVCQDCALTGCSKCIFTCVDCKLSYCRDCWEDFAGTPSYSEGWEGPRRESHIFSCDNPFCKKVTCGDCFYENEWVLDGRDLCNCCFICDVFATPTESHP